MRNAALLGSFLLMGALAGSPSARAQGCSACNLDGECVPVETSGNCSCNIRYTNKGYRICRPQGVCDLLDPNSCDSGGGPQPTGVKIAVDAAGIARLEEEDPVIGTAIRAAAELTFAQNGAPKGAFFVAGIQEGTFKGLSADSGFRFRIVISKADDAGIVRMKGTVTSALGNTTAFDARLEQGGRAGRVQVERASNGGAPRTLAWSTDEKH